MQHIFAHEKDQKLGFAINEVSYLSHKVHCVLCML